MVETLDILISDYFIIIQSLKYQKFTTLGGKDIGIIKSEFVAKTQFPEKF